VGVVRRYLFAESEVIRGVGPSAACLGAMIPSQRGGFRSYPKPRL
jgi:hypothetical protein